MEDQEMTMPNTVEAKTAFNARVKASMREYLRSKSWVEKVESIERMNVADKLAKQAMREAMARREKSTASDGDTLEL